MARLSDRDRSALPDSAFAYVDSRGHRRLPIHDEAHVRAAMSRFNQVRFESDEAREKAFQRVLKAALGYGIAPIGFVAAQMRRVRAGGGVDLPQGPVTLMLTDIEGSTGILDRLGDGYAILLERLRRLIREAIEPRGGYEVDARADEFFAVFPEARGAVEAALAIQQRIGEEEWPDLLRVRVGLHSGNPARTEVGYVGMEVHTAARVCAAAGGGEILISAATRGQLGEDPHLNLDSTGTHQLHGLPEPLELFRVTPRRT